MELLVFGDGGKPVLFFPTRMARFYDYENWGIIDALSDRINAGEFQVYCVDSVDTESFYNENAHPSARINRHRQYEDYILNEVITLIRKKNSTNYLEVAGCSMGAYHAINLAMKHPDLFNKVIGLSGRYDLTQGTGHFKDLLDGYHNEDIYFNMPRQFIANLADGSPLDALRNLEIIFAIGQTDPFLPDNLNFSNLLWHKGIAHQLYIWDNYAHRPRYWKQMLQLYL